MTDRDLCVEHGFPIAAAEDRDRYDEREGEHLCWGAHGCVAWSELPTWARENLLTREDIATVADQLATFTLARGDTWRTTPRDWQVLQDITDRLCELAGTGRASPKLS